jgi:hypothetical protein
MLGSIPSELSTLTNLQFVHLGSNGFSGSIADSFYDLDLLDLDLLWQSNNYINCTSSDGRVVEPLYQMGDPDKDYNQGLEGKFLEQLFRLQSLGGVASQQVRRTGVLSNVLSLTIQRY